MIPLVAALVLHDADNVVVYLALMKITLTCACTHIYCYVLCSIYMSVSMYIMYMCMCTYIQWWCTLVDYMHDALVFTMCTIDWACLYDCQ